MKSVALLIVLVVGIALAAVFWPESDDPELRHYACEVADVDSHASPYVLPYPAGTTHGVNQANCSGHGHSNFWRHGYDFTMDIGSPVTAAREGTVGWARDGCFDGDRGCTNLITVLHADGSVALYSHLTHGGVLVKPGQQVRAGQLIGRSGMTGNTGGLAHLHFSVHPCNALPGLPHPGACPTQFVTFRNTAANPRGLQAAQVYLAR